MPKFILSKVEGIKNHSKKLFLTIIFIAVCGLGVFAFSAEAQAAETFPITHSDYTYSNQQPVSLNHPWNSDYTRIPINLHKM